MLALVLKFPKQAVEQKKKRKIGTMIHCDYLKVGVSTEFKRKLGTMNHCDYLKVGVSFGSQVPYASCRTEEETEARNHDTL